MSTPAPSISMCRKLSSPGVAPNGKRRRRVTSAAMAGCSPATSSRPMKAAISIFSRPGSASRWTSRRFISLLSLWRVKPNRGSSLRAKRSNPFCGAAIRSTRCMSNRTGPCSHDQRDKNTMTNLTDATRNKLKTVSTATVATALFKRGFRIQMIQDVHPLGPDQPVLVGEAFTLRYMPAREDLNKIDVFRDRVHPQRKAIEDCPVGAVLVMDSRKDARAASAGAILVTRLMQRGCAGVITDGGFRDSAEIAS